MAAHDSSCKEFGFEMDSYRLKRIAITRVDDVTVVAKLSKFKLNNCAGQADEGVGS